MLFLFDWHSFSENIYEELIELKCNNKLKYRFETCENTELWLSNTTKKVLSKHEMV